MFRKPRSRSYQEFNNDDDDDEDEKSPPGFFSDAIEDLEREEPNDDNSQESGGESASPPVRLSKACVKNVFTLLLIFIYLLLTGVAIFLVYQTISDFLEKLQHPVTSVSYREVDAFPPPGIALYPGGAELLSCRHHYHDLIPPLEPGRPPPGDCDITHVSYVGPFTNHTQRRAVVVRGPTDVRNKELVFMQFSQNETHQDFSAITYMLFANYTEFTSSPNRSEFMRACERNYSMWTFSGGFRTWVKMSLVRTSGKRDEAVEFRQETAVVKFNDKRPDPERTDELFFAVFEWRDPFMQEIRLIVTANPWNSVAILCGVFMALFKVANFAKLSVQWIIRMRRRHLRNKTRDLNQIN